MHLTKIFENNKLSLSFEVFPPKTDTAFESVQKATEEIARLHPSFMSVTYGAGGGTSIYTLDIARKINEFYNVPTLAHLTCVSSTKETIHNKIEEFRAAGIKNIMALRGDLTEELRKNGPSTWDYRHATELIHDIVKSHGDFCIGGACYPEVHPESPSKEDDILFLKEKVNAGCSFLTTQMFFDNELFYDFLDRVRKAGINVPIVAGIMPITNITQLNRAVSLSGSYIPKKLIQIADKFGSSPLAMEQAGIAYATDQIINLYANDIHNVHVYSMNKPNVAAKIQSNLYGILF